MDQSSSAGHSLQIVAGELDLIFNGIALDGSDAGQALDDTLAALAQEVLDSDLSVLDDDGDGKVSVRSTELVAETLTAIVSASNGSRAGILPYLGNTNHHVLDVRADGTHASKIFTGTEPQINAKTALADGHDVEVQVLEVTRKLAAGALHGDDAGIDADGHCKNSGGRNKTKKEGKHNGEERIEMVYAKMSQQGLGKKNIHRGT